MKLKLLAKSFRITSHTKCKEMVKLRARESVVHGDRAGREGAFTEPSFRSVSHWTAQVTEMPTLLSPYTADTSSHQKKIKKWGAQGVQSFKHQTPGFSSGS